jgi:DNA/RNA endonuclease G (NUC1)
VGSAHPTFLNGGWASWQLNRESLQRVDGRFVIDDRSYKTDTRLPEDFYKIGLNSFKKDGDKVVIDDVDYVLGHLVPVADRNRNWKDNLSINLLSNLVPQTSVTNNGKWKGFEDYTRRFIGGSNNREVYVVAGTYGSKNVELTAEGTPGTGETSDGFNQSSVKIPEYLWKVILVLKQPGLEIKDINATNAYTIGFWMPNSADVSDKYYQKQSDGEYKYLKSVDFIESQTGYDFFSYLPDSIQADIEANTVWKKAPQVFNGAALLGSILDEQSINQSSRATDISSNTAIWHNSVTTNGFFEVNGGNYIGKISSSQIGIGEITIPQASTSKVCTDGGNIIETNLTSTSTSQIGTIEVGSIQESRFNGDTSHIGSTQVSTNQFTTNQFGFFKNSPSEVGADEAVSTQFGSSEVRSTQIDPTKQSVVTHIQLQPSKVSLPSSVSSQQFFPTSVSHDNLSNLLTNIYSTAQSIWQSTPINLTFEVTNLPKGQLAEAQVSEFGANGSPTKATILIDDDANGVGWFIDSTPGDNSEFTGIDTYFQATPHSAAAGKYDLLTAILHEMGHTLGFINGYSQFNQNIKGRQFYTDPTHSYTLSADLSHLDNTLYPNDLLNTNLKPGIRKLPSTMDWAIINAINSGVGSGVSGVGTVNPAHLTAGALIGITDGDFTTPTTWNTAGATNIINGTATLTEQSQKLSELTQAFIIPTGAKTLQFTIKDNHLVTGDTTKSANDAFEVALLDTNTFNPLAGTSIGLNHTDSLLNIQADGTIHKSDKVTITALGNNSSIITIDLTQVTPTTQATLYFNLLGFGARTSTVTIDDVKLFTDTQPIPVTKNDTLTTNQNTPLILTTTQLTTNDTNVSQIQVINQPTHGTITQTPDGKLTYTPVPTYVGNDSFTYLGFGTDGQISNLATVNLTVNNLPPTIQTLTIPTKINEGQNIQLSATATDGGSSDNLTYTWNLGDGTNPIAGRNIAHTYTDNGNYDVTLTVTDADGGSTSQTTTVKVDNLAPIVNLTAPTTSLNQGESLNLGVTYSDAGIKDTHTITWNFGDGSAPVTLVGALGFAAQPNLQSHVFTQVMGNVRSSY